MLIIVGVCVTNVRCLRSCVVFGVRRCLRLVTHDRFYARTRTTEFQSLDLGKDPKKLRGCFRSVNVLELTGILYMDVLLPLMCLGQTRRMGRLHWPRSISATEQSQHIDLGLQRSPQCVFLLIFFMCLPPCVPQFVQGSVARGVT